MGIRKNITDFLSEKKGGVRLSKVEELANMGNEL